MDRGAWWATVHGVEKESNMTEVMRCSHSPGAKLSFSPYALFLNAKIFEALCSGNYIKLLFFVIK